MQAAHQNVTAVSKRNDEGQVPSIQTTIYEKRWTHENSPTMSRAISYSAHYCRLERMVGIEPITSAWEADVLPLNYTRLQFFIITHCVFFVKNKF